MKTIRYMVLALCLVPVAGCSAITDVLLRKALGVGERDESDYERRRRKERKLKEDRKWIKYWQNHPEENPAMTEAFKDDYR